MACISANACRSGYVFETLFVENPYGIPPTKIGEVVIQNYQHVNLSATDTIIQHPVQVRSIACGSSADPRPQADKDECPINNDYATGAYVGMQHVCEGCREGGKGA